MTGVFVAIAFLAIVLWWDRHERREDAARGFARLDAANAEAERRLAEHKEENRQYREEIERFLTRLEPFRPHIESVEKRPDGQN